MKKIYILGEARGAYRVQNLIKNILDNKRKFSIYYDDIFYSNRLLRYLKSFLLNIFIIFRSDIIYVCTLNVDINIFYELFWAWILRKKIIIDYYVSIYDTVVLDRKWFKENSFWASVARILDKIFLKIGTKTLFLDNAEKQYYCKLANVEANKSSYIILPLGIEEKEPIHSEFVYGDKKDICICWWGSYMPLHGIDKVIKAAKILRTYNINAKWYFFGNNEEKGKIYVDLAKKNKLEDICFFNNEYSFKNGKLQEFLSVNCDIALGPFGDSVKAKTVTSNKLIEACTMKSVILTGYSKGIQEFFDEDNSIFMCKNDPESIANAINSIYFMNKEVLKDKIKNQYEIYLNEFSIDLYNKRMERIFDEL